MNICFKDWSQSSYNIVHFILNSLPFFISKGEPDKTSEDTDEMPQSTAFHLGLHLLRRLKQFLRAEIHVVSVS